MLSYFLSSTYAYFVPRGTVLSTRRQERIKKGPFLEEGERGSG